MFTDCIGFRSWERHDGWSDVEVRDVLLDDIDVPCSAPVVHGEYTMMREREKERRKKGEISYNP